VSLALVCGWPSGWLAVGLLGTSVVQLRLVAPRWAREQLFELGPNRQLQTVCKKGGSSRWCAPLMLLRVGRAVRTVQCSVWPAGDCVRRTVGLRARARRAHERQSAGWRALPSLWRCAQAGRLARQARRSSPNRPNPNGDAARGRSSGSGGPEGARGPPMGNICRFLPPSSSAPPRLMARRLVLFCLLHARPAGRREDFAKKQQRRGNAGRGQERKRRLRNRRLGWPSGAHEPDGEPTGQAAVRWQSRR